MSQYPHYRSYGDSDDVYDDSFGAGASSSYGRVTSGQYFDGTPIDQSQRKRPSSSRRDVYDEYGKLVEPGHSSEQDLRRVMYRYGESSSTPRADPRDRRSDRHGGYEPARRSHLSEQAHADDRRSRHDAREQQQARLEYYSQQGQEHEYCGADRKHRVRGERRGAVAGENDEYLAFVQAMREQQQEQEQHEFDERSANTRRSGREYYEWR